MFQRGWIKLLWRENSIEKKTFSAENVVFFLILGRSPPVLFLPVQIIPIHDNLKCIFLVKYTSDFKTIEYF